MQNKTEWRTRLAGFKIKVAQSMKVDYLNGKTIPEICKMYNISRTIVYKWVMPTDEEMAIHDAKLKELKKYGPPRGKRKLRTKIKNIVNPSY